MHKLPDLVPAFSHYFKPLMRDGSQPASMLFHPRIDGRIALDSAVESQQCRFHRALWFLLSGSVATQHVYVSSGKIARLEQSVSSKGALPTKPSRLSVFEQGRPATEQNLRKLASTVISRFSSEVSYLAHT
jgi:hypothetical protein